VGDQRDAPLQGRHPALSGVEVVVAQDRPDRELVDRLAPGHEVAHGGVARVQPQVARVLPVRRDRHKGLGRETLLAVERLERGRLPGSVTVEGVDDLAEVEVGVTDQPADHIDVLDPERRAARRDGCRHPGEVHRHDVRVPLDHDDLAGLRDLPLGQVQPEQHVRLAVHG
jgi:hypothetical protein